MALYLGHVPVGAGLHTAAAPDGRTAWSGTARVVMPLGDSITYGTGSTNGGGYRDRVFRKSAFAGLPIEFRGSFTTGPSDILGFLSATGGEEGHGGFTIDSSIPGTHGIKEITAAVLTTYTPTTVLLHIGTNDVAGNIDLPNAPTRLGGLMDLIFTTLPTVRLVVAQIIPNGDPAFDTKVTDFNGAIPGLVATRVAAGKNCVSVDMYTAFTSATNWRSQYMSDNLHPNDAGYVVIGDTWYPAIP